MKKRIILVEDDEPIAEAMGQVLSRAGYDVVAFRGASPLLNDNFDVPDLFILDKQLHGVSGLDLCRHLKNTPRTEKVPIIIISANPHVARLAAEAGADDYIEKPFRTRTLIECVVKHIGA